jgi:hypothetical protein
MRNLLKNTILLLLFIPILVFGQTLQLGALSSFEAYTGKGAVSNSGIFTGDVGSNDGIISGFAPPDFNGTIHHNNALTVQARIDILRVYIHLSDIFVTHPSTHSPAFGGGETIKTGVYSIGGAGSIGGKLTLDGEGDTNAIFIMKFEGAFTAGVGSKIILINGTRAANVFWIAEGAISVGASSILKGTLFSHPGAVTLGANCTIEGRLFSSEGAITIEAGSEAYKPAGPITIPIYCLGNCDPAPAVDVLGSISNFALFTSQGAVANAATSGIVGDIGTNNGAISGFGTSTHVGSFSNVNSITAQAKIDLDYAYNQLVSIPNTELGHTPAFGSGETVKAGVYYTAGAGSLAGTITLDGKGDPNAIFIFKFNGAFSVAAQSKVIFINGTRRCNVFWISEGAASMGTFTFMKGTVLAHAGACSMGANGNLEGRMLSTIGAIGFSTGVIYNDPLCFDSESSKPLPIELLSFTAEDKDSYVQIHWVTTSEINNNYFNVERSSGGIKFTSTNKVNGAGNSTSVLSYSAVDNNPLEGWSYYRLKQTDYDGEISYSKIVAVEYNPIKDFKLEVYPNPFSQKTVFYSNEKLKNSKLIVYNSHGKIVKQLKNISGHTFTLYRNNLLSGLYFINLIQDGNIISTDKLVVID